MAVVKGSKQFPMVVRRSRPILTSVIGVLGITAVAILGAASYHHGKESGIEIKGTLIEERDYLQEQFDESAAIIKRLSQENADLKLGEEVDSRANEEVRQTVESLQQDIADLQEEVRFYKSVLMPNVEEKGLRIERLDVKATADPRRVRYHLLLTQVVDKHEYVQGRVEMQLVGKRNNEEARISFNDVAELDGRPMLFRFRYFQNIDGEITLPDDFTPVEIMVTANSTGRNGRTLERRFDWQLAEG